MTSEVLRSIIFQGLSNHFRSLFPIMSIHPPSLSQTLMSLFQDDLRFSAPSSNNVHDRVVTARRICQVYYGASRMLQGAGNVGSLSTSMQSDEDVLNLYPIFQQKKISMVEARADLLSKNLAKTLAGAPTLEMVNKIDGDLRQLQSLEVCEKVENVKQELRAMKRSMERREQTQRCYVCLRTIRPKKKRRKEKKEMEMDMCLNERMFAKKPVTLLEDAMEKCGVSSQDMFELEQVDNKMNGGKDDEKGGGGGLRKKNKKKRRRRRLLGNPADLAVALGMSTDPAAGAAGTSVVASSSEMSAIVKHMRDVRVKAGMMPMACGDVMYQPGQIKKLLVGLLFFFFFLFSFPSCSSVTFSNNRRYPCR